MKFYSFYIIIIIINGIFILININNIQNNHLETSKISGYFGHY